MSTTALRAGAVAYVACALVSIGASVVVLWPDSYETAGPETPTSGPLGRAAGSGPEGFACAKRVLVGTVRSVARAGSERIVVDVEVTEWIKPRSGPSTITVRVPDPVPLGRDPVREAAPLFVYVPGDPATPPDVYTGPFVDAARSTAHYDRALAEAADRSCATGQ